MSILEDDPIDPDCIERTLQACEGEPFFDEHEGKRYCVLHFPVADKKEAFESAVKRKLESKDFNYQGVWFPSGAWFIGIEIDKRVDFSFAVFNGRASFYTATFRSEVNFKSATFNEDASFGHTTFAGKVDFSSVKFRKKADFNQARFEAYANFWRCTFTGHVEFRDAAFLQTASFWPTIFNSTASFSHASFVRANFRASEFKDKAVFSWCAFGFAEFIDASFSKDADFFLARFEGMANFTRATFDSAIRLEMSVFDGEARFTSATFNGKTDFSYTVFKAFVSFSAEHGIGGFGTNACDFRHARFETPNRVSFHTLTLRPHWFVNLDPREFEFIDVKWTGNLSRHFIDKEVVRLKRREEVENKKAAERRAERLRNAELLGDKSEIEELKKEEADVTLAEAHDPIQKETQFHRLLSITCRQLAVNAEENHRYDEASDFRFWSMELRHKEGWRARGKLSIGILHTLYLYLSGYGEEIGRAFLILIGIWLLFAFLYTCVGFVHPPSTAAESLVSTTHEVGQPQKPAKALAYSLAVITLQRPDPRPLTATAWFTVLAETILGPIQAALLILAVRRRFMR